MGLSKHSYTNNTHPTVREASPVFPSLHTLMCSIARDKTGCEGLGTRLGGSYVDLYASRLVGKNIKLGENYAAYM